MKSEQFFPSRQFTELRAEAAKDTRAGKRDGMDGRALVKETTRRGRCREGKKNNGSAPPDDSGKTS